ncbi:MAG TPA: hypothetical protein VN958_13340, partial [Chitinophagaceae bacterium]|nr:hypothetical protein [Chitinophagaceae bacterium]
MKNVSVLIIIVSIILFSCNTSTENKNENNSSATTKNAAKSYPQNVQSLFAQLKQNPDSTGLRLLLASAL